MRPSADRPSPRPPRIRPARPEDLAAVRALDAELVRHDRAFDATLDPGWSDSRAGRAFLRERQRGGDGVLFVAVALSDGRLLGYLAGARCAPAEYRTVRRLAELECMYVRPECRGAGVGRRLARAFLGWCRRRGLTRVSVTACAGNAGAVAFYRALGFQDYDLVLERRLR